ncbi:MULTISPECIES: hypothetical protein [unclassified Cupriavidus]|uniref:hypothetical protein n=1 Tax=unclassified Cupriavidus TaxID=2640874 RepID=UPI0010FA60BF|nr:MULTISPECIES: hypothetical protein [unclassified Cupriavidus]MWL92118.1 hypothetical protein [Cupriavidus sp. SW-Y-13]
MLNLAEIERVTVACRRGLELFAKAQPSLELRYFPAGACGDATTILGLLIEKYLGHSGTYICGWEHPNLRENQSHAWVLVSGILIDITHDQFPGTAISGWVFSGGTAWHDKFARQEDHGGFSSHLQWPPYLHEAYWAADVAVAEFVTRHDMLSISGNTVPVTVV